MRKDPHTFYHSLACHHYLLLSLLLLLLSTTMKPDRSTTSRNLYVLNLPLDVTTDQLKDLFQEQGQVVHAVILATLDSLARRRGFTLMSSNAEADIAIRNLDGFLWHGYRIEVSFAIIQRSGAPIHPSPEISDTRTSQQLSRVEAKPTNVKEDVYSSYSRSNQLVIRHVDTSVITSELFLRALTQPFGQVHHVRLALYNYDHGAGIATMHYCCSQSTKIAKQALDGLIIGRYRLSVSVAALHSEDVEQSRFADHPDHNRDLQSPLSASFSPLQPKDQILKPADLSVPFIASPASMISSARQQGRSCCPQECFAGHGGESEPDGRVMPQSWSQHSVHSSSEVSEREPYHRTFKSTVDPQSTAIKRTNLRPIGDERSKDKYDL